MFELLMKWNGGRQQVKGKSRTTDMFELSMKWNGGRKQDSIVDTQSLITLAFT